MKIDCYLLPHCGSEDALKGNIFRALALENTEAEVNLFYVNDTEANILGLKGSPSVFINGEEIQPLEVGGFS